MIKSRDTINKRPNFTHGDVFYHEKCKNYYLLICCNIRYEFGLVSLRTGWSYTSYFTKCKDVHNITQNDMRRYVPTFNERFKFVGLSNGIQKCQET